MNEIFDENGNYIYPTDVILDEPNTATSVPQQTCTENAEDYDNH